MTKNWITHKDVFNRSLLKIDHHKGALKHFFRILHKGHIVELSTIYTIYLVLVKPNFTNSVCFAL